MTNQKAPILLVGDHPFCATGNGNMMRALLERIDYERYKVVVYGVGANPDPAHYYMSLPFSIIHSKARDYGDPAIKEYFAQVLQSMGFAVIGFVGVDCWTFTHSYDLLRKQQQQARFSTFGLFPYDLPYLRKDWAYLFGLMDFPCVYSQFGFEMLQDQVKNLRFFRPPLADAHIFKRFPEEKRRKIRSEMGLDDDTFLFGFVGVNQFRKDPQRLMMAYAEVRHKISCAIYLHMEFQGVFNIEDLAHNLDLARGEIFSKRQGMKYTREQMVQAYNSMDCLVNCSLQEGLSWTPLEAMLCGTPVIATDTTAQTELVHGAGMMVPCRELAYVPVVGGRGPFMSVSSAPIVENISNSMLKVATDKKLQEKMRQDGYERAKEWLDQVSDINELLQEAVMTSIERIREIQSPKPIKKDIIFAQHSSAGDVLMTTQCFKGIKERHPGKRLVYMTQPQFQDIVQGNPYIDEVINWDEKKIAAYEIKYNPHGERILPGGFNSLDTKLYEMYPYFTKVEADDIFIEQQEPSAEIRDAILSASSPICVVHSTGGSAEHRTYTHLDKALKNQGLFVIQIGGSEDFIVRCAYLHLQGKLTWRETAWVLAKAGVAVCVDSAPMHMAAALGTNVVALFGPAPARVTGPRPQHGARVIALEPNKLSNCPSLTNCWSKVGCASPCINTINPMIVRKAVHFILEGNEFDEIKVIGNDSSVFSKEK